MGGIGNQLFQYAFGRALSINTDSELYIDTSWFKYDHGDIYSNRRTFKLNEFNTKYKNITSVNTLLFNCVKRTIEKNFIFENKYFDNTKYLSKYRGYWQSFKYFESIKNEIRQEIKVLNKSKEYLQIEREFEDKDYICLHIRRGDYLENTRIKDYHGVIQLNYYLEGIKYLEQNFGKLEKMIFSDDIEWCRNNLLLDSSYNLFKKGDNFSDYEELTIMAKCKYFIIANSTFSWWSAYLADDNDKYKKLICYPDIWFNSTLINNMMDLFPGHWIMCETFQNKYLLENVYYINLEERVDRKVLVETELKKMKWKYERFNAIKHERGALGCSLSHLAIVEMAKEKDLDYVVILEDDIQFLQPEKYNKMLIDFRNFVESNSLDYDVLLIATNILDKVSGVIPINNYIYRVGASYSAAGYIVKKHYYDKIIANYKEGLRLLIENPTVSGKYEFDVYWIKLQMVDKWLVLYPRTVNQRESYSDILNCMTDYTKHMIDI